MPLVQFRTIDGDDIFINPDHVINILAENGNESVIVTTERLEKAHRRIFVSDNATEAARKLRDGR